MTFSARENRLSSPRLSTISGGPAAARGSSRIIHPHGKAAKTTDCNLCGMGQFWAAALLEVVEGFRVNRSPKLLSASDRQGHRLPFFFPEGGFYGNRVLLRLPQALKRSRGQRRPFLQGGAVSAPQVPPAPAGKRRSRHEKRFRPSSTPAFPH